MTVEELQAQVDEAEKEAKAAARRKIVGDRHVVMDLTPVMVEARLSMVESMLAAVAARFNQPPAPGLDTEEKQMLAELRDYWESIAEGFK